MTKNRRPEDPFAQREADNYANPIPSRELILEELEKLGKPASLEQLWGVLQLHDEDEREALRRRMIAMSRARWPEGLSGRDLDALARMPLPREQRVAPQGSRQQGRYMPMLKLSH